MSSRQAPVPVRRPAATRRTAAHARTKRDSDALIVTVLTIGVTLIAFYDLLLLAVHVRS